MKQFSDEELKELLSQAAQQGAERAIDVWTNRLYREVGKSVMTKIFQIFGVLLVGFVFWAIQQGWLK